MRELKARGVYTSCLGLYRDDLAEVLEYSPDTGVLRWIARLGRGGAAPGTTIIASSFMMFGVPRNTFGVIYLLQLGRLPTARAPFRDRDGNNWRWENIRPLDDGETKPLPPYPQDVTTDRRDRNARARRLKSKT